MATVSHSVLPRRINPPRRHPGGMRHPNIRSRNFPGRFDDNLLLGGPPLRQSDRDEQPQTTKSAPTESGGQSPDLRARAMSRRWSQRNAAKIPEGGGQALEAPVQ